MATSTLIQSLDTKDAAGSAFGATPSHRREVETFIAGAAIASGDWVSFDVSKSGAARVVTVVKTTASAGQGNVVGVAISAATAAGEKVQVVTAGYVEGANVVNGVASGATLTTSGVTAGRALAYATGTHTGTGPCGVALEASVAANTCTVWVFKHY